MANRRDPPAPTETPILCPHCGCKDPSLVEVLKRTKGQGRKLAQDVVFCNVCGRSSVRAEAAHDEV